MSALKVAALHQNASPGCNGCREQPSADQLGESDAWPLSAGMHETPAPHLLAFMPPHFPIPGSKLHISYSNAPPPI